MSGWRGIFRKCKNYLFFNGALRWQEFGPVKFPSIITKNPSSSRPNGKENKNANATTPVKSCSKPTKKFNPNETDQLIPDGKVSYVSCQTFDENKINGTLFKRSASAMFRTCYLLAISPIEKCFVRGLKTGLTTSKKSSTGLFGWAKTILGYKPKEVLSSESDKGQTTTVLQNLSEGLSDNDKEKLKIAFAEGYIAGSRQIAQPATFRWVKIFQPLFTLLFVVAICMIFISTANGSIFKIHLGKQIEIDPVEIHVTFDDVKGADEAKQELREIVEFLKNPQKFSILGGKLPKGVLLVGPPGTGKTLLARAVAGEAGVPFFHAAGPEFDEVLVGQGARRVRDLFKAAKESAPCVIFIDEIDSVGSKRTNSVLHPYANQTINQLLSEMDGFHHNDGVIVLGATNRRDDLDKALLRPGRFDIEVVVPTPDYTGRKEILDLYLSKILTKEVDVDVLARGTTGFTGADLESMVNQAALRAAIEGASSVSMRHLENARDKVLMGPERKTRIPDEEANTITAYHEGGHTIVAYFTKDAHPLHKVTIIPRGPSLGHTAYIPEKEPYHVTKSQLLAMMDTMMGGRAAEELVFGPDKITSGASNDLKQATAIATHMVKEWGMSEKIGLRTLGDNDKSYVKFNEIGQATNDAIDSEITRLLQESYERAKTILKNHAKEHKLLAEALIKYETLDADDIKAILRTKSPGMKGGDSRFTLNMDW